MTTFVHEDGLLVVDSRCTSTAGGVDWCYPTVKLRASFLFAVVGAGDVLPLTFLKRLPFLLMLRVFGRAVFPAFVRPNHTFRSAQIYVVWRNGARWCLNIDCHRVGLLGLARVRSRDLFGPGTTKDALAIGGSGAMHLTLDQLETQGAFRTMARAAIQDTGTDDQLAVFDTLSWRMVQDHPFLPRPFLARAWVRARVLLADAFARRPAHARVLGYSPDAQPEASSPSHDRPTA